MAKHAATAPRSPWRPLVLAVVGALALVSSAGGVLALLRAQATATQSASTGTLLLTQAANGTFGTTITGAAPGDLVHRFVTLSNTGTLDATNLTLGVAAASPNELSNGSTTALRLSVSECSVLWNPTGTTGGIQEGSCGGTLSRDVAAGTVPFSNQPLLAGTIAGSTGKRFLRISFRVPDISETSTNGTPPPTTVQGKSTSLTFTFTEDQRTGTVTSS